MPLQTATRPSPVSAPDWAPPQCRMTYERDARVKLLHLPNEYAHDEAQLLCQETAETWIAWIPDYGETVLHRSEFYSC